MFYAPVFFIKSKLVIKTRLSKEYSFTVSIGTSKVFLDRDINLEAAIIRADKALYKAKNSGKIESV